MDLWGIFIVFFFAFIIMSCCGYCCSRKQRGAVLSAPVVVTSATHTSADGYTVTQMPVTVTTTSYPSQTYTAPYPTQGAPANMPMPITHPTATGVYPYVHPYTTMATTNINPPPYDVAVSDVSAIQSNNTAYEKQAPYNPNYQI